MTTRPNASTYRGSPVYRGPMAQDHYTILHNRVVRGEFPTEYVGVFGYIASQSKGWELTEAKIQKDLKKGRDFVRSALRALEGAHCLIRVQTRTSSGKFGGGEPWFVTDKPFRLREEGVDDEAMIQALVQAEFEKYGPNADTAAAPEPDTTEGDRNPSAEFPNPPEPDTTDPVDNSAGGDGAEESGDPEPEPAEAPEKQQNTRSSPMTDNPSTVGVTVDGSSVDGSSVDGQSAPKKNIFKEDHWKEKKISSSSSSPSSAGPVDEDDEQPHLPDGEDHAAPGGDGQPSVDLLARFWDALPPEVTPAGRARRSVERDIAELLTEPHSWHLADDGPELLAGWFQRRIPNTPISSPVAWLRSQIGFAPAGPSRFDESQVVEWANCPEGCNDEHMIEQVRADGTPYVQRCPYKHRFVPLELVEAGGAPGEGVWSTNADGIPIPPF